MNKRILILLIILLLASCSNLTNDYAGIEINDYNPSLGGYLTSYLIDATTKNSSDEFKANNLLYVPKDDVIKISYGNLDEGGDSNHVVMKVFYDYKMIDFKLADTDTYVSEYTFDLENGKKIDIPILLDDELIKFDQNIHKLLITFTTGYHQNASDFDSVTDEYGINAVYDVVHDLDFENQTFPYSYNYLLPEENFEQSYGKLVLNTDYDNVTPKSSFGGILNPTPSLNIKRGSDLDLMYNFEKNGSNNALLIMTFNFAQVNINDKYAELIKLDGKEGTANGKISVKVPDTPGKYEVIGYVVHNPYEKYSGGSNMAYPSYRFTLIVE